MKVIKNIALVAGLAVLLAACSGNAAKDAKGDLSNKKAALAKLKKEKSELDSKIRTLVVMEIVGTTMSGNCSFGIV